MKRDVHHQPATPPDTRAGRLTARPSVTPNAAAATPLAPGLHRLGVDMARDALLHVPTGLAAGEPVPLIVMLHGAGGEAEHGLRLLQSLADAHRFLLLAPPSRGQTWDIIVRHRYGPDIAFLDASLEAVFARFAVDPARLAIGGFSDGASYALCAGLMNGDLFTHLLAFAPGFAAPDVTVGAPRIYIAHGTQDQVLNIERCSRRLVPSLKRAGYDVRYHEFEGPHTVPPPIAQEAVAWFRGDGDED